MPMEIILRSESQGSSERLKILILCIGKDNEGYSNEIKINELVAVQFHFIQNSDAWNMRGFIGVRKILKDCNVRAKIWEENGYSSEKICTEKTCWSQLIGVQSSVECYEAKVFSYIFEFSVTMYAYKAENMVHKKLYNDTQFTDFSLSTAEGSVAIHKAHLAAHSDVFLAMLSREWKETKEGRINMEGINLQTLQQLKDYIYLGTLPDDDLLPLWSIASCYLIEELKTKCLMKLTEVIKPENFYSMLEYSIENKMPELAFAIIKATPEKVVQDAEKLSKENNVTEETEKE